MGDAGNELYVVGLELTKRPKDVLLQKLLANACMYALAQNDPLTDPPHPPLTHQPPTQQQEPCSPKIRSDTMDRSFWHDTNKRFRKQVNLKAKYRHFPESGSNTGNTLLPALTGFPEVGSLPRTTPCSLLNQA